MKVTVLALCVMGLVACGEEPAPAAEPVLYEGSYGVRYASTDDLTALDDTAVAAINALEAVYSGTDLSPLWKRLVIRIDTSLPEGVDGASNPSGAIALRPYACAGNGSLAHEVAHLAALQVTGNGDSGHHDTRLFIDDCKTNVCAWASVEMVARPLCY